MNTVVVHAHMSSWVKLSQFAVCSSKAGPHKTWLPAKPACSQGGLPPAAHGAALRGALRAACLRRLPPLALRRLLLLHLHLLQGRGRPPAGDSGHGGGGGPGGGPAEVTIEDLIAAKIVQDTRVTIG